MVLFDMLGDDVLGPLGTSKRYYGCGNLSYSADGRYLVAASASSTVMFEVYSGKTICELEKKRERAGLNDHCYEVSPSARRIAGSTLRNDLVLWDARTGKELISIKEGMGSECWVAFTSDGKSLLTRRLVNT